MEKSFSGGGFGLSWGTLKRFWEPLGVVGPSWTSWGPGGPPGVRRFGPNLGPKMEPKWRKNRCKNRSNNLMHLGIDFGVDLEAFWKPKWSHVGTQINQTSMPLAKNEFLKNHCFSEGNSTILKVRRFKLGPKSIRNRSKKEFNMGRHLGIDF